MNTSFAELAPPPAGDWDWKQPGSVLWTTDETGTVTDGHPRDDEDGKTCSPSQTLKSLCELVVGLPAPAEIQAFRLWLCQEENCPPVLHLLKVGLPAKLRAGLELPLDDSIASWVWQQQSPLIIAAEAETRFPDFARQLHEWGAKYFCAVPLMLANRRLGILGLVSTTRAALASFDLASVQRDVENMANTVRKNGPTRSLPQTPGNHDSEAFGMEEDIASEDSFEGIIGRSPAMGVLRQQIKVVAPTHSTVLVLGETGTGKELIARAIHNLSPRRNRPFIKVNCAAIPTGLLESELFGHERGAFTGAVARRLGRFEMANGGTLFLDEIGDIPPELQPKLLRVLQEREFERIGSTQTTQVDVRIVAATSRDLPGMVADREFRADLYYRLNVFPVSVPALRQRSEDIPLLVRHFVELYAERMEKCVSIVPPVAMEVLLRYAWPGNVRELQNVIERAVILSPGKVLQPSLAELKASAIEPMAAEQGDFSNTTTLKDAQRHHILQALAETNWVIGGPKGAASRLGMQRTTLRAMMQRLGIARAQTENTTAWMRWNSPAMSSAVMIS